MRSFFNVKTYDEFGNAIEIGGDTFDIVIASERSSNWRPWQRTGVEVESATVDNGDATYVVEFVPTVSGDYSLSLALNGGIVGGRPAIGYVAPAGLYLPNCYLVRQ
eukprot:SAG22_NODE_1139_length_5389_cov_1.755577_5_plen_106_part_00